MITEVVQTVILLFGSCFIFCAGLLELRRRGITDLEQLRIAASADGVQRMSMVHSSDDDAAFPFYTFVLGFPVLGVWYWCTDQTIVQRVLGAATIRDAQLGPLFAAFIKLLPVPLFVFPGVMAFVLYGDEVKQPDDAI